MSQSASIESLPPSTIVPEGLTEGQAIATSAIVVEVDQVKAGLRTHVFIRVEYIDAVARPDLAGKLSGWLRLEPGKSKNVGDVISIGFTPKPDRLGSSYWAPYVRD
jgi:hypothetical protein